MNESNSRFKTSQKRTYLVLFLVVMSALFNSAGLLVVFFHVFLETPMPIIFGLILTSFVCSIMAIGIGIHFLSKFF